MRHGIRLRRDLLPKETWRSAIPPLAKHFKKTKEDRDLNHHRQTTADRINAVLLVELHHLLVHPSWISLYLSRSSWIFGESAAIWRMERLALF